MSIEVEEHPLVEPSTGDVHYTHIVDRGDDPRDAMMIVLDAMFNGTSITALCGHTWIPSRDPMKYPMCKVCEQMFEFAKDFRGV